MSFPQSIRSGFVRYADLSGAASRSDFWWWILFTVLAVLCSQASTTRTAAPASAAPAEVLR